MPNVKHNHPQVLESIKRESEEVRKLLRRLRHLVEQGQIEPPPEKVLSDLGQHVWVLSNGIRTFTIWHGILDENKKLIYSIYQDPISFVDYELCKDPNLLEFEEQDEYDLYCELGFTKQEYEDLRIWKKGLAKHDFSFADAFDYFVNEVVRELQHARYKIKIKDIIPGIGGVVGIATDLVFFVPSGNVPALVSSCSTGILAIASKFSDVRAKLLGKGK